jgi:CAAX amino terminal protease family.
MLDLDWHEIAVVFKKDLLEVLRDYRTLCVMILMPVLIYPALLVLPSKLAEHLESNIKSKHFKVCLIGDSADTKEFFLKKKSMVVTALDDGNPEQILSNQHVAVVVKFPERFDEAITTFDTIPKVSIFYDAREQNLLALAEVRSALTQFRNSIVRKRFESLNVTPPQKYFMTFNEIRTRQDQSLASEPVRNMLPFLLFIMVTISIIYPSLDIITGERERNTLPLLLMSPTSRRNIMIGKFLVVATIGFGAMLIGLASIYLFVKFWGTDPTKAWTLNFPATAMAMCALISIPLVAALASLAIMLAAWCKTFQQGQGYFVPFLLVVMGATSVCSLPELKLSSGIAFIPLANVALCMKEVLSGLFDPIWVAVTVVASTLFAFFVTLQASKVLDSERLLFGIESSRERRRANGDYLPEVALLLAAAFLLMFYVGQTLQMQDLMYGSILTQISVIFAPALLLVKLMKLPVFSTWSFKRPTPSGMLAALFLAPFCMVLSMLIYQIQSLVFPAPEEFTKMFTRMLVDSDKPMIVSFIAIAIFPGVCEEILFRGTILGLVRKRLSPVWSSIGVGLAFGAFHLSIFRVAPTGILGIVLTALTLITGSIFPAMLLHALNNGMALAMTKYNLEPLLQEYWYVCVISGLVGFLLLYKIIRENSRRNETKN